MLIYQRVSKFLLRGWFKVSPGPCPQDILQQAGVRLVLQMLVSRNMTKISRASWLPGNTCRYCLLGAIAICFPRKIPSDIGTDWQASVGTLVGILFTHRKPLSIAVLLCSSWDNGWKTSWWHPDDILPWHLEESNDPQLVASLWGVPRRQGRSGKGDFYGLWSLWQMYHDISIVNELNGFIKQLSYLGPHLVGVDVCGFLSGRLL